MIDVAVDKTPQGLPSVSWLQQVPIEKRGSRMLRQFMFGGIVIGAVLGAMVGHRDNGPGLFSGIVVGAIFGFVVALGTVNKSMEKPTQQQWAEKPVLVECPAYARLEGAPGAYMFTFGFTSPKGELLGDSVPLDSFEAFEFGSLNEWFSDSEDRQVFGDCFGIVIHAGIEGTKPVAVHSGAKADLNKLHATLTALFVNNRPALQPRLKRPPRAPAGRRADDDDIPDELPL
jgi:hypothetical protein